MEEPRAGWDDPEAVGADPWHAPPARRGLREWLQGHPGFIAFGVVALVTCVVLSGVVIAVTRPTVSRAAVPPNQAGYLWCCNVHDVSATWHVPTLVHPARDGSAEAVWIGAQTYAGGFFLQVGSNEYVTAGSVLYQAFWSDGPLGGSPKDLGSLAPGDVVHASLSHVRRGWVVTFADATQGWTHTRHVAYGVSTAHALAEWIEEDPVAVDSHGSSLFHMAATHGTVVSDLLVNGAPPSLAATMPESFHDATGRRFSPTALVHDAFSFRPW